MRHLVSTKRNGTIEHHFEFNRSGESEYMDTDLAIARCNQALPRQAQSIISSKFDVELVMTADGCLVYLRSK